jgi:hypothetical protein
MTYGLPYSMRLAGFRTLTPDSKSSRSTATCPTFRVTWQQHTPGHEEARIKISYRRFTMISTRYKFRVM